MFARASTVLAAAILVSACGGSGAASPPQPEATAETGSPGKPAGPHKSLADLKREFMTTCGSKVPNAPDYCECGWDQANKVLTEEEMSAPLVDKAKMAQLDERLDAYCKAKLPEDMIRTSFVQGCTKGQTKLDAFCDCTWGEFRKKLSIAEIADKSLLKSERGAAIQKSSIKACSVKVSEEFVRDNFLIGCTKEEALKPFCGCAWKTLRSLSSPADVLGGLVDMDAVRPKIETACSKLRPAK